MLLNSDYFTPQYITGYVRQRLLDWPINQTALSQWLPNRNIDDLTYRYVTGGDTLIEAARYRSFDAESGISGRPGVRRESGELLPMSEKIVLSEYDRLRGRANPDASIQQAILSDAVRMVKKIIVRLEIGRADALVNGSLSIAELGGVTKDFSRSSGMEVTASTLWSNVATSSPITDLVTWQQAYVDQNGVPPGVFLTSTRVRGLLLQNATIRTAVSTLAGTPDLVSKSSLDTVLDSYDLPPLRVYDARHAGGRYIADNVGLFLPPAVGPNDYAGTELGATFYGTTAESLDPSYNLAGDEAGIVAGVYRNEDPISIVTKASAIAVPILINPDLAMRAVVAS